VGSSSQEPRRKTARIKKVTRSKFGLNVITEKDQQEGVEL
jgi:hypothetical protein